MVRSRFGCSSLTGAELENQGGAGSKNSHWCAGLDYCNTGCGYRFNIRILFDVIFCSYKR